MIFGTGVKFPYSICFQESDEGIVSDQSSSADPEDANKRIKVSRETLQPFKRIVYALGQEEKKKRSESWTRVKFLHS